MTIGQRLQELRELIGISSIAEVARQLGLNYSRYYAYETDANDVNSEVLRTISNFYEVPIDYILGLRPNAIVERSVDIDGNVKIKYLDIDDAPELEEIPDEVYITEYDSYIARNTEGLKVSEPSFSQTTVALSSVEFEMLTLARTFSPKKQAALVKIIKVMVEFDLDGGDNLPPSVSVSRDKIGA